MAGRDRTLYEFPHSHFCEIARWALDHKGLRYRSVPLFPGYHAWRMRRLGCASSLPVLDDYGTVVQGSGAILDYLDERYPERMLTPVAEGADVHRLEADLASAFGVPLRRLCYAHLVDDPGLVRYFFMHRSGPVQNVAFRAFYPLLVRRLTAAYDTTPDGARSAERELAAAVERYDARLAGRDFLVGERFSRADITFASLLVFMVMPPEFPVPWPEDLAAHPLGRWFSGFRETLSYAHAARSYRDHRRH